MPRGQKQGYFGFIWTIDQCGNSVKNVNELFALLNRKVVKRVQKITFQSENKHYYFPINFVGNLGCTQRSHNHFQKRNQHCKMHPNEINSHKFTYSHREVSNRHSYAIAPGHGWPSPIGLSILRDIESNMCCTKISGWDYFSKSRNCNLHLLVHKVLLKFRCENEINKRILQVYLLKNRCWSLPFRKTLLIVVATPSDWRTTASSTCSRRFWVYTARFLPKVIQARLV